MTEEKRTQAMTEAKNLYLRCQFDAAFAAFHKLAAEGCGEAMYFLGEFYTQGYGHITHDMRKGRKWREKGAAAGDILSLLNTAYTLPAEDPDRQGIPARLFPKILAMAEAGNLFAQNELPDLYLYGLGTEKNPEKAVEWLTRAGSSGFWRPLNKLGEMYYYGEGIPKDRKKARQLFEKAAALGYGDAEANLAMCCYNGEPRNMTRAVSLLRRAFAHGALFEGEIAQLLGLFIVEGMGVKKDETEAFLWMKRSAERDYPPGMNYLAIFYERGIGTVKDRAMAEKWCRRAADRGHIEASIQYGIFQREDGNLKESLKYFENAAVRGNPDGQVWLASCYLYGLGTEEDREEARMWLEKAAAQHAEDAVRLLKEELGIEYKEDKGSVSK